VRKPLRLTWEQCEAREFHVWGASLEFAPEIKGFERKCKTCGRGAVETMRRRKAAADARRVARQEEVRSAAGV
jgi:hypothetical protein